METPAVLPVGSVSPERPVPPSSEGATDLADLLDWDQFIAVAPVRPHGTIAVRLIDCGKARPIPVPEPEGA